MKSSITSACPPGFCVSTALLAFACLSSCSSSAPREEEIRYDYESSTSSVDPSDTLNSVSGQLEMSQIATYPQRVVLNGMPQHRLVAVYKYTPPAKENRTSYYDNGEYWDSDQYVHYMPGLDLLFGYHFLNVAHYDMKSEKLNYLFPRPVLIKSLYFPSYSPDSVGEKPNRKPINRDYFLISAYDEDTNADTLLNRHDLRRFYHFNASCDVKTQLIPADYSVIRSQYDFDNDVMYIYARQDSNKNGRVEDKEPIHVFWISLKTPAPAKRMY